MVAERGRLAIGCKQCELASLNAGLRTIRLLQTVQSRCSSGATTDFRHSGVVTMHVKTHAILCVSIELLRHDEICIAFALSLKRSSYAVTRS